ncbi:hypothetical protein M0802_005151 [Mischocyttarus mexicanus]|nr:hypothetical protein M0802_005151 [Mischocyttarus mexicanus]
MITNRGIGVNGKELTFCLAEGGNVDKKEPKIGANICPSFQSNEWWWIMFGDTREAIVFRLNRPESSNFVHW